MLLNASILISTLDFKTSRKVDVNTFLLFFIFPGASVRDESKVQRGQVHNRAGPHDQGKWLGVAASASARATGYCCSAVTRTKRRGRSLQDPLLAGFRPGVDEAAPCIGAGRGGKKQRVPSS